jgi:hypothetical protein
VPQTSADTAPRSTSPEELLCDALYEHKPAKALQAIAVGATGQEHFHFSQRNQSGQLMSYAVPVSRIPLLDNMLRLDTVLYNATVMAMDKIDEDVGGRPLPGRFMALVTHTQHPEERLRTWLAKRREYKAKGPDMLSVARALMAKGMGPQLFTLANALQLWKSAATPN